MFHGCNLKSQGLYSSCLASRDRHGCMSTQIHTQTNIHTQTLLYIQASIPQILAKAFCITPSTQFRINRLSHSWYTHTHTDTHRYNNTHNTYHTKTDTKTHTSMKFLHLSIIFTVAWACSGTYDVYKAFILKGALQPWPVLISSSGTFSMQILAGPIRTLESLHRYHGQQSTKLPRKSFLPIAFSKSHFWLFTVPSLNLHWVFLASDEDCDFWSLLRNFSTHYILCDIKSSSISVRRNLVKWPAVTFLKCSTLHKSEWESILKQSLVQTYI